MARKHWTQTREGKRKLAEMKARTLENREERKRLKKEAREGRLKPLATVQMEPPVPVMEEAKGVIPHDKLTIMQVVERLVERVKHDQRLIEELQDLVVEMREGDL